VKVKRVQVKNKELAAKNIRDGKLRQGRNAEGVDKRNEEDRFTRKKRSRSSEDDSGKEYLVGDNAEKSRGRQDAARSHMPKSRPSGGSNGKDSSLVNQLESEIVGLQSKLNQYHEQVTQLEQEMEQKCNKCNEEVELGK